MSENSDHLVHGCIFSCSPSPSYEEGGYKQVQSQEEQPRNKRFIADSKTMILSILA